MSGKSWTKGHSGLSVVGLARNLDFDMVLAIAADGVDYIVGLAMRSC